MDSRKSAVFLFDLRETLFITRGLKKFKAFLLQQKIKTGLMNMTKTLLQKDNFYKTSDFALAVVLSLSFPIYEIDKENPRRAYFVFEQTKELDEMVDSYYRDDLKISPMAFFNQTRALKARLYDR
ncbi:MAG: DUF5659 domain-containing protein [Candidatus Pacebacteria bacterium]|nr:DUF5659 domain-containing protein [Candidatus Paceibacterota bacterium]